MQDDIEVQVHAFYQRLASDPHHRYRSWEHCFTCFSRRTILTTPERLDTAALHLAFYLASWGMYRGSSALLWKDYTIHKPAISNLLAPRYQCLWDLQLDDPGQDTTTADLILSLARELSRTYSEEIKTVNGKPVAPSFQPTDTLITKILLGTIGCTPACDRFFIDGFRHTKLPYSRFGSAFLREVFQFYRDQKAAFWNAQHSIKQQSGINYPPMQLLDMYFWQIGSALPQDARRSTLHSKDNSASPTLPPTTAAHDPY